MGFNEALFISAYLSIYIMFYAHQKGRNMLAWFIMAVFTHGPIMSGLCLATIGGKKDQKHDLLMISAFGIASIAMQYYIILGIQHHIMMAYNLF